MWSRKEDSEYKTVQGIEAEITKEYQKDDINEKEKRGGIGRNDHERKGKKKD